MSSLTTLAATANENHQAANEAARSALEHARASGEALYEAKARLEHGEWTPWLASHFDASPRTARLYMRIARRWEELEAATENGNALPFSIREAADLLAQPDDGPDPDPDPDPDDSDDDEDQNGPEGTAGWIKHRHLYRDAQGGAELPEVDFVPPDLTGDDVLDWRDFSFVFHPSGAEGWIDREHNKDRITSRQAADLRERLETARDKLRNGAASPKSQANRVNEAIQTAATPPRPVHPATQPRLDRKSRGRGVPDDLRERVDFLFEINTDIHVAFCSRDAALEACRRWHYSGAEPAGKLVTIGVWEKGRFVGAVIFGNGPIHHIHRPFGFTQPGQQRHAAELVRVALADPDDRTHETTTSLRYARQLLGQLCPDLRILVSFADSEQGHHGGLYQAAGWRYIGDSQQSWIELNGEEVHPRSIYAKHGTSSIDWLRENVDPDARRVEKPPKHKYAYPLDNPMRRRVEQMSEAAGPPPDLDRITERRMEDQSDRTPGRVV